MAIKTIKNWLLSVLLISTICYNAQAQTKLGLQLFSLREMLPKDVSGTLKKVANAGYNQVELYGFNIKDQFWGLTPSALASLLQANQLTPISGHFNMLPYLQNGNEAELIAAINAAKTLKLKYITIPWLPIELRKTADDYLQLAKKLNYAGKLCKDAGIKLAYHNHDFEFEKFDGKTAMDLLLANTDQTLVDFELDIYWAVRSGIDPIALFKANPNRFKLWHIKDMDKNNPSLNTEVGKGSIDYRKLYNTGKMYGAKYFFVEHETNYEPDMIGSITQSAKYLKTNVFKKVK